MSLAAVDSAPFDVAAEVALIAELLLGHAAEQVARPDPLGVVAGVCEALTASTPHLVLAWTWFGPTDTRHVAPQIMAGRASSYARGLNIDRDTLTRDGPAFRALAGLPSKPFRVSAGSSFEPWRQAAAEHGIRSVLALPLRPANAEERGIFVLYASREDYFERVGVGLFDALARLFAALLAAATERSRLEAAASSDPLTGLGNRRGAGELEHGVRQRHAAAEPSCLLLIDIDHFKSINDRHGHRCGDQVLREVAQRLRAMVRETDRVLRWGGEEFLIGLPGASRRNASATAEGIRAAIEATAFDAGRVWLTVSIGLAEIRPGALFGAAVEAADGALYAAKRAGRNRVIAAPD